MKIYIPLRISQRKTDAGADFGAKRGAQHVHGEVSALAEHGTVLSARVDAHAAERGRVGAREAQRRQKPQRQKGRQG